MLYKYKDSHRSWWEIEIILDDASKEDFVWTYKIFRDKEYIHSNDIVGQYDEQPSLQDILYDFNSYISGVCIGASKYASEYGRDENEN